MHTQIFSHIHYLHSYNLTRNVLLFYLKDKEIEVQKEQEVCHRSHSYEVSQPEPKSGDTPVSVPGCWLYHYSPTQSDSSVKGNLLGSRSI